MKIAALQMISTPDVARNLDIARRLIDQAVSAGARLVALPEYFCLMGHADRDKLGIAESPGEGPIQAMLSTAAEEHGVWVIGGTLPMKTDDPERVANACCVYAPDGSQAARYDKIHLFRFDSGKERYDEARVLQAGHTPVAFDMRTGPAEAGSETAFDPVAATADSLMAGLLSVAPEIVHAVVPATSPDQYSLRVGLTICYDVRFPELYRALSFGTGSRPCDLIAVPAAFTHTTGLAHWELLLRARAVENQCYVIAPAQGGLHENGRRTFGHSLIVDPWGTIVAMQEEGEGVVIADIDLERLAEVRKQLPALEHRML
ncbi:carbon-nitrogen hydrolase family protein [soil metagenome]